MKRTLAGAAAGLVLAFGLHAAPPPSTDVPEGGAAVRAEPELQPPQPAQPAPAARADLARAVRVSLPPASKVLEALPAGGSSAGVPLQVGFARAVPALSTAREVAAALQWQGVDASARVAALTVSSPGALGLRAGLAIESLPANAIVRFHAPASQEVIAVTGAQIDATLALEAANGADSAARIFWSPVVDGDTVAIEIELPAGVPQESVRISVPTVSHLVVSPRDGFAKASASCELDAMCYQDAWSVESNAVARIIFTEAGSSFVCSGTLLADRDTSTTIPYFITANHCVSTQAIASSVQAYWFYRATACNSGVRGASQTTFGGGVLLYASTATDTAFMRLNTAPPAGVAYAGWIANQPTLGAAVTGIHHPAGDLQKMSFGNVASYWSCSASTPGQFSCSGTTAATASFMGVAWRSGLTEGGSSGSGLFTDSGRYLVGQLFGGTGTCSAPGTDFYGRFDLAYNAGLSQWLGTTSAGNGVTPASNYSDLWWNAAESGWGLSLTQHGNALFAAWFVYDSAGKPTWYVMPGGTWTTSTTLSGDIYATTGPDPMGATFDPTRVVRTKVGSGTLKFASTTQATFSYTVNGISETRSIAREPFGSGAVVTNGYGDLWWNASESGWGLTVHQQGNTLFGVWYTYAPDGTATWYVMPGGTWTASDTYIGDLFRASYNGTYFGRPFNAAGVTRADVGHLTIRFVDANTALMTYSVDGVFGVKQVTRQPF